MPQSKTSRRRVRATERQREALELRKAGHPYSKIGEELGISAPAAHGLVSKALAAIREESSELAEDVIRLELERLDALLAAVWDAATVGESDKVDRALKIMKRRAELLGLDAPTRQEIKTDTGEEAWLAAIFERAAQTGG